MKKAKTKATIISLILTLTIAASLITLPVNAQFELIMNLPGAEGEIHYLVIVDGPENYDIDLNAGPGGNVPGLELWIKYPGRADFTFVGNFTTTGSGDFDYYDFDFNETGTWELKWEMGDVVSNIEIVVTVSDPSELPPQYIEEFVYVAGSPVLSGVGQQVLIVAWTADMPPDIGEQQGDVSSPTGRAGWYDMSVTITKPDQTTTTLDFPYTDPVGATWTLYTPMEAGTYVLQSHFPGAWKNSSSGNRYYEPDDSDLVELTVQEEPITAWPENDPTEDYWMRPINTANRFWYTLAGNWLGGDANRYPVGSWGGATNDFAYGRGTETPHILWTKQYYTGGLMDERYGSTGYATAHYQGIGWNGIVVQGKLHYTPRRTHAGTDGWAIVDLYTGEELFMDYDAENRPSRGQVYDYESPNQHGGFAYTWRTSGVTLPDRVRIAYAELNPDLSLTRIRSSRTVNSEDLSRTGTLWEMLDAQTDQTICYVANVSTQGRGVYSEDGSIRYYNVRSIGGTNYLQIWNNTAGTMVISPYGTGYWQWRPAGGGFGGAEPYFGSTGYTNVHDGNLMYTLNVSIPSLLGPRNARQNQTASIQAVREGEYVVFGTSGINDDDGIAPAWFMAVSLEPGHEGDVLWETTFNPPYSRFWGAGFGNGLRYTGVYPEDGVVLYDDDILLKYYAYDMATGAKLYETEPQIPFAFYGMSENYYNGILYSYGYGGVVYAYNITTGDILWKYEALTEGFEAPYGGRYPIGVEIIADGKLYTVTGEHSPTQPLFRGPNLRCLDAETGEENWKILGYFGGMSPTSGNILMADGILVGLNLFDAQLYAFGRGPSATTVTASPKASVLGESKVVIEGTVTDQTQGGRRNTNDVFEFSLKGTPAISDEDMGDWMEYMFMQQEYPVNAKGVEVVLSVYDANNNYYEVGRTTSDATGHFVSWWEPEIPGEYLIVATFEGSDAYGPSQANTAIYVDEAPAAPGYQGPSADQIAQATINRLPPYPSMPNVPTAAEVAQETINRLPAYPEIPDFPDVPTASEVAQETVSEMPEFPETPAYLTIDLVILVVAAIGVIIGLLAYMTLRRQ